ncbi:rhomboid family intramembrane serine protease [Prevotella bivia]|uniref:Putative membrane protein n=1 Tax=Prevotella bivia DSM 20514 TaxID=868129 RepID=I4Z827_9BACT|nr:rhomboid family intramembrane serine protease [Prevotella bivia]EFB92547.1 peptidase, S54 family [Prevotella bivia JCVIHMP010]EIM32369.1 putative membrane protein [Prevotella bivia DSM 20514]
MRNIPTVTKNLLFINIIAFIATYVFERAGIDLTKTFGLHFILASDFHIWQFVTYMFMHAGFMHILMNMFMLWMFGMVVERVWGAKKFLFYYIVCGIGAGFCQELAQFVSYSIEGLAAYNTGSMYGQAVPMDAYLNLWTTVGASGAIYAVLLAFGMLFPEERMFIIPIPVPIKAKWIIVGSVAMELFSAFGTSNDGVAHLAHLGGMLFGFILIKYWKKHPYGGYNNFGMNSGSDFFDKMKHNWEQRKGRTSQHNNTGFTNNWNFNQPQDAQPKETDWDYNARKKQEQEEIDRILDKVRKNGYDSLTPAEKQRLFDSSKH